MDKWYTYKDPKDGSICLRDRDTGVVLSVGVTSYAERIRQLLLASLTVAFPGAIDTQANTETLEREETEKETILEWLCDRCGGSVPIEKKYCPLCGRSRKDALA